MNTEVIIIIVVAVLVLLAVVAFFLLKKEKFSTTQQPTARGVISVAIREINYFISYIHTYYEKEIENALSDALYYTKSYVSKNINAINNYIADNKAVPLYTKNNIFTNSLREMQDLADQKFFLEVGDSAPSNLLQPWILVSISNYLLNIYLNIRLYEENTNTKINTNMSYPGFNKEYNHLLTLFPQFLDLFNI